MENVRFEREVDFLLGDFWKKFIQMPTKANNTRPAISSDKSGWLEFKKKAACIAEREWNKWDQGRRHETNPKYQDTLLQYYLATGMNSDRALRLAKSNLSSNSNNRDPWSAAFISYIMREAGAGSQFHYSPSHYVYMTTAKKNRLTFEKNKTSSGNPFQLFSYEEQKPEIGDLVCNWRGCFKMTYDNIQNARGKTCLHDGKTHKYKAMWSHCDLVVEIGLHKGRKVAWVIGGNTSDRLKGLSGSTVGKKPRFLDQNGFLKPENNVFALLKIRTDINATKPPIARSSECRDLSSSSESGNLQTSEPSKKKGVLGSLVSKIESLLDSGKVTLQVSRAILEGQRNVNQLTDMLFFNRHKERNGRKITRNETDAIVEWQRIKRDEIVPLLEQIKKIENPIHPKTNSNLLLPTKEIDRSVVTPAIPGDLKGFRKFRLTTYYIADQANSPIRSEVVPIYSKDRIKIADASPEFFAKLSLEGTGKLVDGRLVKVTGGKISVDDKEYRPVFNYHKKAYHKRSQENITKGKNPVPTGYSGIFISNGKVSKALSFQIISSQNIGQGYGIQRGIPFVPFRTLAADIGHIKYNKVDKKWKGKGGLVPPKTKVYIREFDGLKLPDQTIHDGWFIVNDTGGGIFGAHFDVFTGTKDLRSQVKIPSFAHVWFSGIENRIPPDYTYGLTK